MIELQTDNKIMAAISIFQLPRTEETVVTKTIYKPYTNSCIVKICTHTKTLSTACASYKD